MLDKPTQACYAHLSVIMPVQKLHKQSDLEKRLKILESQLYGKAIVESRITHAAGAEQKNSVNQKISLSENQIHRDSDTLSHSESFRTDISYLRQDLTKIALLSSLAIGIQLVLYFSQIVSRVRLF